MLKQWGNDRVRKTASIFRSLGTFSAQSLARLSRSIFYSPNKTLDLKMPSQGELGTCDDMKAKKGIKPFIKL